MKNEKMKNEKMKNEEWRMKNDGEKDGRLSVTDLDAIVRNTEMAVERFTERYIALPRWVEPCEIMSVGQMRDEMGLRRNDFEGDPWPQAEELLAMRGFHIRMIAGVRGVIVREREMCIGDGWEEAEEVEEEV